MLFREAMPTAKRPRGVVQAMEQRLQKASGRMQATSAGSIQEQFPRGVELRSVLQDAPSQQLGPAGGVNLPEVSYPHSIRTVSLLVIGSVFFFPVLTNQGPFMYCAARSRGSFESVLGICPRGTFWVKVGDLPKQITCVVVVGTV
jgi:hypothetical protein